MTSERVTSLGSLHHFPLKDGLQAKDISHPYGMKLAVDLVPNTGHETAVTFGVSVLQCIHPVFQCISQNSEIIIVRSC